VSELYLLVDFRGVEKLQYLKSIGADHVIDPSKDNVIESAKSFLKARGLKGVDVLYDPVGGQLAQDSLKLLNWGAHILVIGFASGDVPVIRANIALVKVRIHLCIKISRIRVFRLILYCNLAFSTCAMHPVQIH
jgi:NADPH:quinone reductase-like Zn-dependent oxidoreductase